MRILLDDEPSQLTGDSVGEAIEAASALAANQGRLIVEVIVDGQSLTPEQIDDEATAAKGAGEVRLVSASPRDLASEVFVDAGAALDQAEVHQTKAAELLQAGDAATGLKEFNTAVSLWLNVQQAIEQASAVADIDLEAAEVDGVAASAILGRLKEQLSLIREQLQSQDLVGVADSLLYDFPAVIAEWRSMLERLGCEIRDG